MWFSGTEAGMYIFKQLFSQKNVLPETLGIFKTNLLKVHGWFSSTSYSIYHDLLSSTYEYIMCSIYAENWCINFGCRPKWDEIKSSYQIHNGKYITCHILTQPDTRCVGFNSLLLEVSPRVLQ